MLYFSSFLPKIERAWTACNGATRDRLLVINKTGADIPSNVPVKGRLGVLDKGRHHYLFVNTGDGPDRVIWLDRAYGFRVLDESGQDLEPLWSASSVGGYGNSRSKIAVVDGAMSHYVAAATYKMRRGYNYYRYIPGQGIEPIEAFELPWELPSEV